MRKEGARTMRCEEIKKIIVDFHDKCLDEKVVAEINEHLSTCICCRKEYEDFTETVKWISRHKDVSMRGISTANSFDRLMSSALAAHGKNRSVKTYFRFQKSAVIALIITFLATVMVLTPAAAAIKSAISNFTDYIFEDKGIANSIQKGYGQVIDKSDEYGGLKFTVHSAVADENRTVLLVGASYDGILAEKPDSISFYGMGISDKSGNTISDGYGARYNFDNTNMELSGNIDLGRIKGSSENIVIKIMTTVFSKQESSIMDIKLADASIKGINREIRLDNEVLKNICLKNIIISGNSLKIEYDVSYTDKKFMQGGSFLKLLKNDGAEVFPNQSGMSTNSENNENIGNFLEIYDISGLNLTECKLQMVYPKPVKVIDGDWKLQFRIDDKAAKKATITLKPDISFNIGGYSMKITKAVFTPSATNIRIESKDINPLAVLGQMSLKTKSGNIISTSIGGVYTAVDNRIPADNYPAEYNFDPVYQPEDLILLINSATIPEKVGFQLELTPEGAGVEKGYKVGSKDYIIKYRFLPGKMTEVVIKDSEIYAGNSIANTNGAVYIENSESMKVYPERAGQPVNANDNAMYFIFSNSGDAKSVLHIESIARNRDVSFEIPIK